MSYYHYKLKCVYCMKEINPEKVVYKYQFRNRAADRQANQRIYYTGKSLAENQGTDAEPVFGDVQLPQVFYENTETRKLKSADDINVFIDN